MESTQHIEVSTEVSKKKKITWFDSFIKTKAFIDTHGAYPSAETDADLSEWIDKQRSCVINGSPKLSQERILLLTQLPDWETQVPSFDPVWIA